MKKLLALPLVALIAVAFLWARGDGRRSYTSPGACVEAYYQALKDGDSEAYHACVSAGLGSPSAADLKARSRGLLGWIVHGNDAVVTVDEQYAVSRRRQKIHLEQEGMSWRVARVELLAERPADIPYGTHVNVTAEAAGEPPAEAP